MFLSREEELMLDGEFGEAVELAARVVVKVAEVLGASRLMPIKSAHISGISYKNIGDAGLEFLKELTEKNAHFRVPTTINPAGFDFNKWQKMKIDDKFFIKQCEIVNSFSKMGARITLSCIPYTFNKPAFGDHIAWSESNAVLYANSIIGARTNREGGPLAIFEAIIGRAPYMGLHLTVNRQPNIYVDFTEVVKVGFSPSLLGYTLGVLVKNGVPFVKPTSFLTNIEDIKLFLAAVGASSSIAMVLLDKYSPEAKLNRCKLETLEKITVSISDVEMSKEKISKALDNIDAFLIGCPHLSCDEIRKIYLFLENRRIIRRLILFTSRDIIEKNKSMLERLEKSGVEIYADTCMVVSEIANLGLKNVAVDSAKAAYYLTSQGYNVSLLNRKDILESVSGDYP
ncbi:MAG: hypothetical protein DRJ44_03245 [Thermoprotei archaeon]|nr:MAG: hypothetical protein DRJ44_03245 [Thermoprotei archaeon]